jgi:hypothetical protein
MFDLINFKLVILVKLIDQKYPLSFKPLASSQKYMSFNNKNPSNQLGQFEKIGILVMLLDQFPNFSHVHVCGYVICRWCLLFGGGRVASFLAHKSGEEFLSKLIVSSNVTLVQMNVGFF